MSKSYMNLDVTYEFAVKKMREKTPQEMAANAGAEYDAGAGTIKVSFLGENYIVDYSRGQVRFADKPDDVPITSGILILHYLVNATGAPMQNKYISFKELPDGAIYIDPFTKRAIRPMLGAFAEKQEEFVNLALSLGGRREKLGDTAVTVFPFPRVPITYVIWSGDDEFPASGNILFDASAPYYLPTEDYAMLAGTIIYQLAARLPK